jgi:hypothetical protein
VVAASFLPWRATFLGAVSPVALEAELVGWGPLHVLPPLEQVDPASLSWSALRGARCDADGETLRSGGVELRTAHAAIAGEIADRLSRSEAGLAAAWIEHHTDVDQARARLAQWADAAGALRATIFAFTAGLLLSLAAAVAMGPFVALVVLAALAPCSCIAVPILYGRAHRRLHPRLVAERWTDAILMALYPAASLRAYQKLAWGVTAGFHPVTVASALDAVDAERELCDLALRDLIHPPAANLRGDAYRGELARRLRRVTTSPTARSASLPEPVGEAFCPRCLDSYSRTTGSCSRCPRVPLVAR